MEDRTADLRHKPTYTGLTGCSAAVALSPVDGVCICGSAELPLSPPAACGGVAPAAASRLAATSGLPCSAAGSETCPAAKGDGADAAAVSGEGNPLSGDGVVALTEAEGGESEATGKLRTQDVRGARHDCGDPLPCWAGDLGEDAAEPAWDEASLTCGIVGSHGSGSGSTWGSSSGLGVVTPQRLFQVGV